MNRRGRRKVWLCFLASAAMLAIFASDLKAETTIDFHGYLESNIVLRDENGVQYGFMDHLNAVQQRNTLKFDVDVHPDGVELGDFKFDKVHLTYRGAYDSIFDLRANSVGENISEKGGPSRFDYGLRDIRFENDLREATMDFTYDGPLGSAFFRPGRQLVSWGESSPTATLLDVINPADNSYQMFFQNPDDVKIPLWMGRLNYSPPRMGPVALNVDLLWIPDIRPTQFGPLESAALHPENGAPYSKILPFGDFPLLGFPNVREDVPTEKQEYGVKIMANIGERLIVSLVYFRDVTNDPGIVLIPDATFTNGTALLTHDTRNVWGGYFSYNCVPIDTIIRGEYSYYTAAPIALPLSKTGIGLLAGPPFNQPQYAGYLQDVDMTSTGPAIRTFRMKPVNKWMMAFDKDIMVKWIAPHQKTKFTLEWSRTQIQGWESVFDAEDSTVAKATDIFGLTIMATWFEGRVSPMIVTAYNPGWHNNGGGTGMIHPVVTWNINPHLYTTLGFQAFFGDTKAQKSGFAGFAGTNTTSHNNPLFGMLTGGPIDTHSYGTSELTFKVGYEW